MYIIYGLIDPRDYATRYIGMTRQGYERFWEHLHGAPSNQGKVTWLQEVEAAQQMVVMEILDKAKDMAEARQKEAFWIRFYTRYITIPLVNKVYPKTDLLDPSPYSIGFVEVIVPLRRMKTALQMMYEDEYFMSARITGVITHEDVELTTVYIALPEPQSWFYIVVRWLRHTLALRLLLCYRFRVRNGEWATFGDERYFDVRNTSRQHRKLKEYPSTVYEGSTWLWDPSKLVKETFDEATRYPR